VAVQSSRLEVAVRAHELAYTIVTELAPERRRPYAAVRDFRLRRVRERLIEEPSARPVLDDLARDADLGKSQLCALFLREYGLSMGEFWTGCRIAKARALLLEGRPAKDVASELGFTDQAYFSRIFKRHTGLAPGVWTSLYRRNRGR
jgi:AraC-like DNA-binding protein